MAQMQPHDAAALVREPPPMDLYRGLSPEATRELAAMLEDAAARTGCTRFLPEHLRELAFIGRWGVKAA